MAAWTSKPYDLKVRHVGDAVVVTVRGSVGMQIAPMMNEQLRRIAEEPAKTLVLDLTDLEFIGADGLDAFLSSREIAKMRKGQVKLVNPSNNIRRILELTRLTQVFPIHSSVDEAVSADTGE